MSQDKQPAGNVAMLQKSAPYDAREQRNFPAFTYQDARDPELAALRQRYNLDSVAGTGSDTTRVIRLLAWFHNQVPHQDTLNIPVLNAVSIIQTYREKKVGQGCYPLSIGMNEVLLSMGFYSRSVICFSGLYPSPHGGHVINTVYIPSLEKWIYIDPQENAYLKDEAGYFLSIAEVRARLISGQPIILNATANYHGIPTKKEEYLYQFMAEHIYRLISPLRSEYNSQTREAGKTLYYVELLPAGSVDPHPDMFETGVHGTQGVITYHTNNDKLFWELPVSKG